MIIYQAMAGRLYPKVTYSILNSIPSIMQVTEFHYPYQLIDSKFYTDADNIMEMIPRDLKHLRHDGFLYGVFPTCNLNKKNEDFLFTILNHPVDNIYELYTYWKFTRRGEGPRVTEKVIWDSQSKETTIEKGWRPLYTPERKVYRSSQDYSLEEYIEKILNYEIIILEYGNVQYEFMKEMFYGFENIKNFNFIGKYSDLNHSFKKLSKIFNCEIKNLPHPFSKNDSKTNAYIGDQYKRNELEELFKKEIEFYNNLNEIFPE
jgi:hypothetical protein